MSKQNSRVLGVGFAGWAGSGKTEAARMLVREAQYNGRGAIVRGFADPLKMEVRRTFDLSDTDVERIKRVHEGRELLVAWGMFRRWMNLEWWVRLMEAEVMRLEAEGGRWLVAVPDVRFPNEVEWLGRRGWPLVWVSRPGVPHRPGPSEPESLPAKLVLQNAGSLEDLERLVRWEVWEGLLGQHSADLEVD